VATPELNLIAEMADLFEVSIDALIGYQFRNNNRETVITRLKQYSHDRDTEDVFSDVEKALQCYPNCFDVVYYSARIYRLRGLTQKNAAYSKKALSLCERACILIGQNKDPEISDVSVRREMAEIHFALGEYDKGIALLKENNPCRLNHSSIGMVLASSCNDPEGALPFLSRALLDLTVTHFEIVVGYMNVFCKTKDYANALALVDWALAFYPGLKDPKNRDIWTKAKHFFGHCERMFCCRCVKKKKQSTAFGEQRMLHCTSTNHQITMFQVSDLFSVRLLQALLMILVILP
jgi:tetratricopeptide (TPR) repeat protein